MEVVKMTKLLKKITLGALLLFGANHAVQASGFGTEEVAKKGLSKGAKIGIFAAQFVGKRVLLKYVRNKIKEQNANNGEFKSLIDKGTYFEKDASGEMHQYHLIQWAKRNTVMMNRFATELNAKTVSWARLSPETKKAIVLAYMASKQFKWVADVAAMFGIETQEDLIIEICTLATDAMMLKLIL